jgi:ABC-2 type transport system permease protein
MPAMLNRIRSLIIKELLAVWRDKKSRTLLIVPPMLMLLIFAYAVTLEVRNVTIGVLNQDQGVYSRELLRHIQGAPTFQRLVFLQNRQQAETLLNTETALLVLQVQPDFSKRITAGKSADVQLILDGRRLNAAQIVQGYLMQIVSRFNQDVISRTVKHVNADASIVARNWFNPNLDYIWFTVPSLVGVLSLNIALNMASLSVARERELGTFDQLLVSPLLPFEILIGKTVPALIVGLLEGTLMIAAGVFVFKIPFWGSLPALYISMFFFLMSITGIGLFISSLAKTQQQALLGSFMFSNPAIILSGYATPIENMPDWLQPITLINPLRYFLVIVKGSFLKAIPASVIWDNTWPLVLIGTFTLIGAGCFFRGRLE